MIAHPSAGIPLDAVRVGRTDLGAGVATIEDDAMIIALAQSERPLRLRFEALDSVHRGGSDLELTLRDGTRVIVACADTAKLYDDVLGHGRTVPELTRTLRAFGSRRGRRGARDNGHREQQRFFAPLIDARRGALGLTPGAAVARFNGAALLAAFDETLRQFAADRYAEAGPARRALQAELEDVAEPMFDALRALAAAGERAATDDDDLRAWRAWSQQLRATFETADRVWLALDAALDMPLIGP
jgi:hypothetical protein